MKAKQAKINNLWRSKKKKKTKKEEKKTLTGAACVDKQMKGMQRFHSVTLSPSTIARGPSQSLDQRQTEGGGQRQTDTQSLSKSGPSVVSQTDVDPPPRAPVGWRGCGRGSSQEIRLSRGAAVV